MTPTKSTAPEAPELKPCPHCNGPAENCRVAHVPMFTMVGCKACECHVRHVSEQEAIRHWNTRHTPPAAGWMEGVKEAVHEAAGRIIVRSNDVMHTSDPTDSFSELKREEVEDIILGHLEEKGVTHAPDVAKLEALLKQEGLPTEDIGAAVCGLVMGNKIVHSEKAKLEAELDQLRGYTSELQIEADRRSDKIRKLEREVDDLKDRWNQLDIRHSQKYEALRKAKGEVARLKEEAEHYRKECLHEREYVASTFTIEEEKLKAENERLRKALEGKE